MNVVAAVLLWVGALLIVWATIFVTHEISVVQEIQDQPLESSPSFGGPGVPFRVATPSYYDYFDGSREAFLLLHAWVVWLGAWLALRKVRQLGWLQVSLLAVGVAVLLCGHALAWWLSATGPTSV